MTIEARKRAQKRWYQKNREAILAKRAAYYRAHKKEKQEYGRIYHRRIKKQNSSKQKDTTTKENSLKAALKQVLEELNQY